MFQIPVENHHHLSFLFPTTIPLKQFPVVHKKHIKHKKSRQDESLKTFPSLNLYSFCGPLFDYQ